MVSSELITRRRLWLKCSNVPTILRRLGVDFRVCRAQSFWEANAAILADVYREFQEQARERMRELHPDRGGDGYEFGRFVDSVRRVQKSFAWHLPRDSGLQDDVEQIPRRGSARNGFYDHVRTLEAVRMMKAGTSKSETARSLRMSWEKVTLVRETIRGIIRGCPCGKAQNHVGVCRDRIDKSPAFQRVNAKLSATRRAQIIAMSAREWDLRDPSGNVYHIFNLSQWIRDHVEMFDSRDIQWKWHGRGQYCRAAGGLARLRGGRKPALSWKGWTLACGAHPKNKPAGLTSLPNPPTSPFMYTRDTISTPTAARQAAGFHPIPDAEANISAA